MPHGLKEWVITLAVGGLILTSIYVASWHGWIMP
jgi:hypothetical protein